MINISENINWSEIGNEVRSAISESLSTGDFSRLGNTITNTVSDALNSAFGINFNNQPYNSGNRQQTNPGTGSNQNPQPKIDYNIPKEETFTERWINENRAKRLEQERQMQELEKSMPLQGVAVNPPFKQIGRVSGVLYSAFGGIGIGLSLISMLVFNVMAAIAGVGAAGVGISKCAFIASLIMTIAGAIKCKRLSKAKKYYRILCIKRYCNVDEIALRMNISIKSAIKDIKRFLRIGFFPQGHLSKDDSCFMLYDSIYNEYLELEKQRALQLGTNAKPTAKAETKPAAEQIAAPKASEKASTGDAELDAIIADGESCISRLREMNDNIPGEEISTKLSKLENLLREIFLRLKDHPEQKGQMHKFMSYYLPMTLKLVSAYEEFDSLSVQSEDIVEAKSEIERTLDAINDAFSELLGRLFRDAAFDAATDAQVLKTMLANEGLTGKKPFSKDKPGSEECINQ